MLCAALKPMQQIRHLVFGKDNAVIGSLAVVWNPESILAEIDASRQQQVLAGLLVVFVMSGLAILAVRKVVTTPLLEVNARTLLLSEGDLESPGRKRRFPVRGQG